MPIVFTNSFGGVADATTPLQFTPTNAHLENRVIVFCSVGPGTHDSSSANFSDPGGNSYTIQSNDTTGLLVTDERAIIASTPGTTAFAASGNMGQVFSGIGTAIISMAFEASGINATAENVQFTQGTGDSISAEIETITNRCLLVACVGKHRGTAPAWADGHGWTAVQGDISDATAVFTMRLFYKIVSTQGTYTWADSTSGATEDWVVAMAAFPAKTLSSSELFEVASTISNILPMTGA